MAQVRTARPPATPCPPQLRAWRGSGLRAAAQHCEVPGDIPSPTCPEKIPEDGAKVPAQPSPSGLQWWPEAQGTSEWGFNPSPWVDLVLSPAPSQLLGTSAPRAVPQASLLSTRRSCAGDRPKPPVAVTTPTTRGRPPGGPLPSRLSRGPPASCHPARLEEGQGSWAPRSRLAGGPQTPVSPLGYATPWVSCAAAFVPANGSRLTTAFRRPPRLSSGQVHFYFGEIFFKSYCFLL